MKNIIIAAVFALTSASVLACPSQESHSASHSSVSAEGSQRENTGVASSTTSGISSSVSAAKTRVTGFFDGIRQTVHVLTAPSQAQGGVSVGESSSQAETAQVRKQLF